MAATCSCRTTALRTFLRSVAQVHQPPTWHEARRQLHQARTPRWPAVAALPYRAVRTAATGSTAPGSAAPAVPDEAGPDVEMPVAAAEAPPGSSSSCDASSVSHEHDAVAAERTFLEVMSPSAHVHKMLASEIAAATALSVSHGHDAVAEDRTSFDTMSPWVPGDELLATEKAAATMKSEADKKHVTKPKRGRPRKSIESTEPAEVAEEKTKARKAKAEAKKTSEKKATAKQDPSTKRGRGRPRKAPANEAAPPEDPQEETITAAEIEAEQRRIQVHRARVQAERRAAREKVKQEEARQKEEEMRRREKEHRQNRPAWAIQKEALKAKFPEGWRPRRKLSPDALRGIRALHGQFPDTYTTPVLAAKFEVSPEAIRRILKARWEEKADVEVEEDRQRRWHNRGVTIWEHYAAIGKKPPAKWRKAGVGVRPKGGRREWQEEEEEEESRARRDRYDSKMEMESAGEDYEVESRIQKRQNVAKQLL